MKTKAKDKESFIKELNESLTKHIADKDLDAWFFNDFAILEDNHKINSYLNRRIPGKWYIVALSGNWTNVGQGIFYEPKYDVWLDLSCYDDEYEEFIDDFDINEKCMWKFEKEEMDYIAKLKNASS